MRRRAGNSLPTLSALPGHLCLLTAALMLVACGGSSSGSSSTYTIGGTISGLTTSSVTLANGNVTVTVQPGAVTWSFPSAFAINSLFTVTVKTQPSGELCIITSGDSGKLTTDVSNITVVCSDGLWTWEGGSNVLNAGGVYGTQGTAAATNLPGARQASSSWIDSSGTVWLFGGYGYASGNLGDLNDLWQYSATTAQWTWVGGADTLDALGVYGTQNVAASSNLPGARHAASSWLDSSGNLWLFGGYGYDATGYGDLNDLWQYSPSSGEWTWISGSNVRNGTGVYGVKGSPAPGNMPGARGAASSWTDPSSGILWLFGGYGHDTTGALANLNDLWQYSPGTGNWTWVSGADTANSTGVYGSEGVASASSMPGARQAAATWTDSNGNLWLFGGYGYDATGTEGNLDDLWQYSPSTGEWTWISGGTKANAAGVYGTQSVAAAGNMPGGRQAASSWIDSAGNLWLYGGYGSDSSGTIGNLDDLWEYNTSSGQWTWSSGSEVANSSALYGTEGTATASNQPGGRQSASAWIDASGALWLFGGVGYGSASNGYLNDLWKFTPPNP